MGSEADVHSAWAIWTVVKDCSECQRSFPARSSCKSEKPVFHLLLLPFFFSLFPLHPPTTTLQLPRIYTNGSHLYLLSQTLPYNPNFYFPSFFFSPCYWLFILMICWMQWTSLRKKKMHTCTQFCIQFERVLRLLKTWSIYPNFRTLLVFCLSPTKQSWGKPVRKLKFYTENDCPAQVPHKAEPEIKP